MNPNIILPVSRSVSVRPVTPARVLKKMMIAENIKHIRNDCTKKCPPNNVLTHGYSSDMIQSNAMSDSEATNATM